MKTDKQLERAIDDFCGVSTARRIARWFQRCVRRPACEHEWQRRTIGRLESQLFYGEELTRICLKCGKTEKGWTQQGRRYDERGKRVEMHRIHWPSQIEIEDRDMGPSNKNL